MKSKTGVKDRDMNPRAKCIRRDDDRRLYLCQNAYAAAFDRAVSLAGREVSRGVADELFRGFTYVTVRKVG